MKLAIVGSRSIIDKDFVFIEIDIFILEYGTPELIISGGARGVDTIAEEYASQNGIETCIFKPDWKKYGKSAGIVRNKDIISKSTHVLAFQENKSKGTQSSINLAKKMGKTLKVIEM